VNAVTSGTQLARVLIGGTASLLICIFLSPKFIEFLRRRSFGPAVRDDGPQHTSSSPGTPDDGRAHHVRGPGRAVPRVTSFSWNAVGVFLATIACALLGFIDDT